MEVGEGAEEITVASGGEGDPGVPRRSAKTEAKAVQRSGR
jgi:hypothetical protein